MTQHAIVFTLPCSGAINVRGIIGNVTVVEYDKSGDNLYLCLLDFANTVAGKRLNMHYQGRILAVDKSGDVFNELHLFITPNFLAGQTTISNKGIFDSAGRELRPPNTTFSRTLGIEISADEAADYPNVWFSWMVQDPGTYTLRLLADGKRKDECTFSAMPRPRVPGKEPVYKVKVASGNIRRLLTGDSVSFPLKLADLDKTKRIALEVIENRAQKLKKKTLVD